MSDSNASYVHQTPTTLRQQLELFRSEIKQKLDDLIYKEEVNRLRKVGIESVCTRSMYDVWAKVCPQRASVSVSCQTDEQPEQDCGPLRRSSTHLRNLPPLRDENNEVRKEEKILRNEARSSRRISKSEQVVVKAEPSTPIVPEVSAAPDSKPQNIRRSRKKIFYPCPDCKAKFAWKYELLVHQRKHLKSLKCKFCIRVFTSRSALTRHCRSCHRSIGELPFKCTKCGKFYATMGCLKSHSAYHRKGKHQCTVCGKAFHRRQQLASHMVLHTGEKPFRCKFCPKGFKTYRSHANHVRSYHTN